MLDNRILNYLRKKQRETSRLDGESSVNPDAMVSAAVIDPNLKRRLVLCLRKLCRRNLRYARILLLHYQGYRTDEICRRLGVKQPTVYSALSKARTMLEECLDQGDVRS